MTKKESYIKKIQTLLSDYLISLDDYKLSNYLINNSKLPSPRANLELAFALHDVVLEITDNDDIDELWDLFSTYSKIHSKKAPTNDPKEFLPFCGILGVGAISINHTHFIPKCLTIIKKAATDRRWRIREAVAKVLHKLIDKYPKRIVNTLVSWLNENDWLLTRSVITGLSHPQLLENDFLAKTALEFHLKIIQQILGEKDRRNFEFKVIRKALAYTFSITIVANPEKGFENMRSLILVNDPDINWIIRQNLKKNRLKNRFPEKIQEMYETFDNFQF